jgi:hypothetical protein
MRVEARTFFERRPSGRVRTTVGLLRTRSEHELYLVYVYKDADVEYL